MNTKQSQGIKLLWRTRSSLFLILFVLTACLQAPDQDPSTSFVSEKIPELVEKIANPNPAVASPDGSLFPVAVIDEGVDYLHPYLKNRIIYNHDGNKITGAGWDFFGNDAWAYPSIIEYGLFSFGAQLSDDKRIEQYLQDPLRKLDDLNKDFMDHLVKAIHQSEGLKSSLFLKISPESFHLISAYLLLMPLGDLEIYRKLESSKWLVDLDTKPSESVWNESFISYAVNSAWVLDSDLASTWFPAIQPRPRILNSDELEPLENLPKGSMPLVHLKGFDIFLSILKTVVRDFEVKNHFRDEYLDPFFSFYRNRSSSEGDSPSEEEAIWLRTLYARWHERFYKFFGTANRVHWDLFQVCQLMDSETQLRFRSSKSVSEKMTIMNEAIQVAMGRMEEASKYMLQLGDRRESNAKLRRDIRRQVKYWENIKRFIFDYIQARGAELFVCDENISALLTKDRWAATYENYYREQDDAHFAPQNYTVSHGTHVAGIITAQTEEVGIYPVRLTVQSIATTADLDSKTKSDFLEHFSVWLKLPLAEKASLEYLSKIQSDEPWTRQRVESMMKENFDEIFESDKLTFYFVSELLDSLKLVAKKKIKIANISLGIGNEISSGSSVDDTEEEVVARLRFLVYEYMKYQIGSILQNEAKNTLFVVAAGNDGQWMDGKSRSGLPCDIGSPLLMRVAREQSLSPAPNNDIRNILCVGSLNKDLDLSSFTNLTLNGNPPFIVAKGEKVLSAVKATDVGGISAEISKKIGDTPEWPLTGFSFDDFLRHEDLLPDDLTGEEAFKVRYREAVKAQGQFHLVSTLFELAEAHQFRIQKDEPRVMEMDGTSMASPAVAGRVAAIAIDKMKQLSLKLEDVYENPLFSPRRLIEDTLSESVACSAEEKTMMSQMKRIKVQKSLPNCRILPVGK